MNLDFLWYRKNPLAIVLWPISVVYCTVVALRRGFYRFGLRGCDRLPVPVVVIGNITVGGTGKTPLVLWLANYLTQSGFRVGIITRGYKGKSPEWPREVLSDSDPDQLGDEPVLLARYSGCPVYAGPDRVRTARRLLQHHDCDVLLSDDGLQHYRLYRDMEIAVVDSSRLFGNGLCLPAGPLREPRRRLRQVDLVVYNGHDVRDEYHMELMPASVSRLGAPEEIRTLDSFLGSPVHAVAGIGHPRRFFAGLTRLGLDLILHPMPDHHRYRVEDVQFNDDKPVLVTQKDAVKLACLGHDRAAAQGTWFERVWVVNADAVVSEQVGVEVENRLRLAQTWKQESHSG